MHPRSAAPIAILLLSACVSEAILTNIDRDENDDNDSRPDFDTEANVTPPVAVCAARPNPATAGEPVDFIGENSYDPDDSTLISHVWQLAIRPDGSRARLPTGAANVIAFEPDVLGDYVATLVVTDEAGQSSNACAANLSVEPTQALLVELVTVFESDDLELAVSRSGTLPFPAGYTPNCSMPVDPDVCSGRACTDLDWGQTGNGADDPEVLADDVSGGAEVIAIEQPIDGVYTIGVFDRAQSAFLSDHEPTVRVWVNGSVVWSGKKKLAKECAGARFVQVAFPSGQVTAF